MIPNEIIHMPEEKFVIIRVTRRDGSKHDVIVDDFMYQLMKDFHIYVAPVSYNRKDFYARTYVYGKQYLLHRLLLDGILSAKAPEVDHIDPFRTLDNRHCNLRPADRKLNMLNLKVHNPQCGNQMNN